MALQPVTLQSARLLLDQPNSDDIPAITRACQDPVFEDLLTLPWPYLPEHAEFFVNTLVPRGWETGVEATWAIRPRMIGDDAPHPSSTSALYGVIGVRTRLGDLGYWMSPEYRGQGFMPEAIEAVISWLADSQFVPPENLTWSCVAGNYASAAVARKSGFSFTGVGPAVGEHRDGTFPEAWHARYTGGAAATPWPQFTYPQG